MKTFLSILVIYFVLLTASVLIERQAGISFSIPALHSTNNDVELPLICVKPENILAVIKIINNYGIKEVNIQFENFKVKEFFVGFV